EDDGEQRRGDERRSPRIAHRLPEDAAVAVQPAPQRRPGGDGLGRGGHCAATSAGPLPYSARNVSSSDGSRLTQSASSYFAAARTTGAILPLTFMRSTWSVATTSDTPDSASKSLAGTGPVKTSSTV